MYPLIEYERNHSLKNVEGLLFSLLTIPHNWPSTSKMIGSMRDHVDIIEEFPCFYVSGDVANRSFFVSYRHPR